MTRFYSSSWLDLLWLPNMRLNVFRVADWRVIRVGRLAVEIRIRWPRD